MRYSTEPKYRKFVKGYGFLSFAGKFGDKYGKKLMDTATKTGIDDPKTTSKTVVQKTAEAAEDLIGKKKADKITSVSKTKKRRWKARNPHTTRKNTANYEWFKIILTPFRNRIPKNYKTVRYSIWCA